MARSLGTGKEGGIASASSSEAKGLSTSIRQKLKETYFRFSKTAERMELDDEAVKEVILPRVLTSTTLPRVLTNLSIAQVIQ